MRILYITQWFEPEPAFKGLPFVQELIERGADVEVATGFPNYPGGKIYAGYRVRPWSRHIMSGVTVYRLFLIPSHDKSSIGRALNYASFFVSVLLFGLLRGWRYDAVYVYHPPVTPALAAAMFTRIWRTPFAVEIQDLWPDSALASNMLSARYARVLEVMCNFVYRKAHKIVAQSNAICAALRSRGVPDSKLTVIYNWSNYSETTSSYSGALPAETINCVYGGNLGQAQSLETVIRAALAANVRVPSFRLHLFGAGIEADRLAALVASSRDGVVTLHGAVSRERMDRIFEASDMLVLHLNDDPLYTITIPSKLQHYMSCGKPVIAGLDGEAADIVHRAECGLVSAPLDVNAMADNMVEMARMNDADRTSMGGKGRSFYNAHMSFENALAETEDLLRAMAL